MPAANRTWRHDVGAADAQRHWGGAMNISNPATWSQGLGAWPTTFVQFGVCRGSPAQGEVA